MADLQHSRERAAVVPGAGRSSGPVQKTRSQASIVVQAERLSLARRVWARVVDDPVKAAQWAVVAVLVLLAPLVGLNYFVDKQKKICDALPKLIGIIVGCPDANEALPSKQRPSEAEIEYEREKARRETLEKTLKEMAAARPTPAPLPIPPPAPVQPKEEPPQKSSPAARNRNVRPNPEPGVADVVPTAPKVAAKSPAPLPPTQYRSGCAIFGGYNQSPIPIRSGTRICSEDGSDSAVIERVTDKEVTYKVNGGFEKACGPGDQCAFLWSSGQLMFRVRLGQSQPELVPSRF